MGAAEVDIDTFFSSTKLSEEGVLGGFSRAGWDMKVCGRNDGCSRSESQSRYKNTAHIYLHAIS